MVSKTIKLRQVGWHCLQLNSFTQEGGLKGLQVEPGCWQEQKRDGVCVFEEA